LHDGSAVALGLTVGDVVSISDRGEIIALTITGTWRPNDVDDPFWYGVQLETDGADSRNGLIAVVSPSVLAAIPGTNVTSRWRLVPELPGEFTGALEIRERVRLALEPDHIGVWPHAGQGAAAAAEPGARSTEDTDE
jgi:hypothetical protein